MLPTYLKIIATSYRNVTPETVRNTKPGLKHSRCFNALLLSKSSHEIGDSMIRTAALNRSELSNPSDIDAFNRVLNLIEQKSSAPAPKQKTVQTILSFYPASSSSSSSTSSSSFPSPPPTTTTTTTTSIPSPPADEQP